MLKYVAMKNKEYLKLLEEYVSFKSVSTDPAFRGEIKKTYEWLAGLFNKSGFKVEILRGKSCNPVVFASYKLSKKVETVLVYGHYDVQPAEKEDGWKIDPFKVLEENGRLVARGVIDNKGQTLIHIYTVLELVKSNKLKYNVKFLVEGNEETANDDMQDIINNNKLLLKSDYVLISDGEILNGKPVIETSLRGGFNCTLKYITAKNNVHSGIFGGAVPNASYELSKFLSKLYDENNVLTVSGIYKGMDKITPAQIANNKKLMPDETDIYKLIGVKTLLTEKGKDFFTQVGLRTTIQITGIKSGYIGEGYANIIPYTSEARLNFRTVASQKYVEVMEAFRKFVAKNTPKFVEYELIFVHPHDPVKINTSSPKVAEVMKLLEKAFGVKPFYKPVGGAIPVVGDFKKLLGIDTLLVSLGNDDCNMHGVNENFDIAVLEKGLAFSKAFFSVL